MTGKRYRLFKVAKELNTGSSTLVDHLTEKGFEVNNSPNEKLSEEMYNILLKDFASEKVLKQKAEEIKEKKQEQRFKSMEQPAEEEEEILSAQQLKSGILEGRSKRPQTKIEAKTEAKEPEKVEKKATTTPESEDTGKKGPALKVKGKIDLSQFERGKKKKKEEVKKEPEAEKKVEKPVEKKEEPVEKKVEEKKEPVVEAKEEPKVKAKPEEKKTEKPEVKETKETPETKEKVESPEEKEEPEKKKIRASDHTPKLAGLKILDKIELPEDKKRKSKTGDDKKEGDDSDPAKKKRRRKRKRKKPTAVSAKEGAPNEKKRERKKKEELSDKEISDIIKSTLADLNRGASRSRQRVRREKRAADAKKREKEQLRRMEEAMTLEVTEFITANEMANMLNVPVTEVITKCMELGLFVSINQRLEADVIQLLAEEYGFEVQFVDLAEKEFEEAQQEEDDPEDLDERAPIITVMGHVDHGKTSLLDYVRNANVIAGEAGGITQHIGAYEVSMEDGRQICFLDTPGHEAFTAMRARGAKVTDLVIIVVAVDDNVMPQTKEAINHSEAAGVPMIFALNKIDKPNADPEKIRQQLSNMNILLEDWGGKFQSQEISAKTGQGVPELLEKVLLEADILELKANAHKRASGTIIEAKLDKGRGVVATVLVQDGTLRIGDSMVAGIHFGRVRAMMDERGNRVQEAGPSTPVQLLGLTGTPQAGDRFVVYDAERKAKEIAQKRNELYREQTIRQQKRPTLEEIARRKALGDFKELNIIVKGDVDGSVEALSDSLLKLSIDEIQVNVIHKAVGQITEADVLLASASDAIIIGFQVRPSVGARQLAGNEGIDVRLYSVIYDAINEVKDALEGMLSPDVKEEVLGSAEVREVFKITKVGNVAGCMVLDGTMNRKDKIRLIREGIVIYEGELSSLKRFKDDVREVNKGFECGMQVQNYNDIKVGDVIEQYRMMEIARKLK